MAGEKTLTLGIIFGLNLTLISLPINTLTNSTSNKTRVTMSWLVGKMEISVLNHWTTSLFNISIKFNTMMTSNGISNRLKVVAITISPMGKAIMTTTNMGIIMGLVLKLGGGHHLLTDLYIPICFNI